MSGLANPYDDSGSEQTHPPAHLSDRSSYYLLFLAESRFIKKRKFRNKSNRRHAYTLKTTKHCWGEINEDLDKRKASHIHGSEDLILVKLKKKRRKRSAGFCRNWQDDPKIYIKSQKT